MEYVGHEQPYVSYTNLLSVVLLCLDYLPYNPLFSAVFGLCFRSSGPLFSAVFSPCFRGSGSL